MRRAPAPPELFGPERLLAFSDGVFAVVITLLVLELRLPPIKEGDDAAVLRALLDMRTHLLIFVFTFLVVGVNWLIHHRKFSFIERVDSRLLWLNLFYLMALCLVPFATDVLSEHGGRPAFVLYAGVMALLALISAALSAYGLRRPFTAASTELRPAVRRDMIFAPLCVSIIFLVAAGAALRGRVETASWMLLAIVPVSAFFGSRARASAAGRGSA